MRLLLTAIVPVMLCTPVLSAPMLELKGMQPAEGCIHEMKTVSERLTICSTGGARIRIWCPNGRVFDRDGPEISVAVARSICDLNQLP